MRMLDIEGTPDVLSWGTLSHHSIPSKFQPHPLGVPPHPLFRASTSHLLLCLICFCASFTLAAKPPLLTSLPYPSLCYVLSSLPYHACRLWSRNTAATFVLAPAPPEGR